MIRMADSDQELLLEDEESDINQNQSAKNAQSQSHNFEMKGSKNHFQSKNVFDSYQDFKHFFRSYRTMLLIDVFCSAFSPNGIYYRSSWAFTGKLKFLSLCYRKFFFL